MTLSGHLKSCFVLTVGVPILIVVSTSGEERFYIKKHLTNQHPSQKRTEFQRHFRDRYTNEVDDALNVQNGVEHKVEFQVAMDGGWSGWQPWSDCQTTCGAGYRVRERWCNRPSPSDGGKVCEGPSSEKEPCRLRVHCPVNGGWGQWTPWSCSVTCGGGMASRTRLCDSPPAVYGGVCLGSGTEIRNTSCNFFTCPPTRKISNETISILQNITRTFHVKENVIPEGTPIAKILCGTKQLLDNLMWELKLDFKHALSWVKNGEPWKEDKSRIDKITSTLNFKKAAANDTGFYSCELDLLGGGRKILKAFSLIVTSNKTNVDVTAGQPFEVDCNAMVLGIIYPNARVSWYFNDTLYQSFNETPATLTNTLKFPFATLNMTGPWECRTYELDIRESTDAHEKKSILGRMKDKVFKSKKDNNKEEEEEAKKKTKAPAILNPLFKHVSTPAPPPKVVDVNPPKSIGDMLQTPQFMGLCVGVAILAVVVTVTLLKGKASALMGKAQGNLQKMGIKTDNVSGALPNKTNSDETDTEASRRQRRASQKSVEVKSSGHSEDEEPLLEL